MRTAYSSWSRASSAVVGAGRPERIRLELARVDAARGVVTELPLQAERSRTTFRLRADVPRGAALRLRCVWETAARDLWF